MSLKILITERIRWLNIESPMGVGSFFNSLNIVSFAHLPYTIETITNWNTWVVHQKEVCIERSRSNAIKMPAIKYDKLGNFFHTLTSLGLLDQSDIKVQEVRKKVFELLENPTL